MLPPRPGRFDWEANCRPSAPLFHPYRKTGLHIIGCPTRDPARVYTEKDLLSTSSSLLATEPNRFSQPDPPPKPRPAMRARGMTDGGINRPNFLRSDPFMSRKLSTSHTSPSSPNIPMRQNSVSRPGQPASAPPTHDLPPPPTLRPDDPLLSPHSPGSTSSSSLTFSSEYAAPIPRGKSNQYHQSSPSKSGESGWEPDPAPRTLKKSMSHQSLKRGQSSSSSSSQSPLPEAASPNGKIPRKQRSFHRLPVPPVPLQINDSTRPLDTARKRLFSASNGRRPSQSTLQGDDGRSIQLAPEPEQPPASSIWIDTDQPPQSPVSAVYEYTPQQIMSPQEMLKVEASVEAAYQRPRTNSIMSSSTGMSDYDRDYGLSPVSSIGGRRRSNSDHPSVRSGSISDASLFYQTVTPQPQPPSPPAMMSLPPPPRRPKPRPTLSRSNSEAVPSSPLSPPPRKTVRPKVSVEERMHRRAIMRKPSFLDIDDEMDKESTHDAALMRQSSFLDLTRGSFDSTRSDSD
ncbi:hypothetical protein C8J57DRAFT_16814 [Mycena rebaudengoi]|nr:hypothetical protein C8J57DRAFT_16814 [Mycena rebaudengoi]